MKKITIVASIGFLLLSCTNKENEYDATGTFEVTEVTASAMASGQLLSFVLEEGENVAAESVVGRIDDTQLKLKKEQLESTKAQLDANRRQLAANRNATSSKQLDLEKQVAALRQQITNAKREKQRYTELLRDGAVPKKQVDDITYQINVLEKQLSATQDQIRSNNASLAQQSTGINAQMEGINAQSAGIDAQQAQLDDQIANSVIKSPISGVVLEKYVEQGEFVTVGKPLFKVADITKAVLRAYVTSAQLEHIKVGQAVKVFSDYGKGKGQSYNGTISWISPQSEFTPKTIVTEDERADLVYAVKISLEGNSDIKMGMYGKVKF